MQRYNMNLGHLVISESGDERMLGSCQNDSEELLTKVAPNNQIWDILSICKEKTALDYVSIHKFHNS